MNYKISLIDWRKGQEELRYLREQVFVIEWQLPIQLEFDHHDPSAFHLVARCGNNDYVAAARMTRAGEIGRIAVRPKFRSLSLYKTIFSTFLEIAEKHEINKISVRCNLSGIESFIRHGFRPQGKVFMEGGIPMQRLAYPTHKKCGVPDIRQLH